MKQHNQTILKGVGQMKSTNTPETALPGQVVQAGRVHSILRKRIGTTVYEVSVHFNMDSKETMNDKIIRLVQNDTRLTQNDRLIQNDLSLRQQNAKMNLPLTGRLPERSS